jgi:hypothetical protein
MTLPVSQLELYCYIDINPEISWPMYGAPDCMDQAPPPVGPDVSGGKEGRAQRKPPEYRPNEIMLDRAIHHF